MKKSIFLRLLSIAICLAFASPCLASPGFGEVVDNLDAMKQTSFHVKQYFIDHRGKEVAWSAKVIDVTGKSGKAKVTLVNDSRTAPKGFNIVLTVLGDTTAAAALQKGATIKFSGRINNYKQMRYGGAIIYLVDAKILN